MTLINIKKKRRPVFTPHPEIVLPKMRRDFIHSERRAIEKPLLLSGLQVTEVSKKSKTKRYDRNKFVPETHTEYLFFPLEKMDYTKWGLRVPTFYRCEVFKGLEYKGCLDVQASLYKHLQHKAKTKKNTRH